MFRMLESETQSRRRILAASPWTTRQVHSFGNSWVWNETVMLAGLSHMPRCTHCLAFSAIRLCLPRFVQNEALALRSGTRLWNSKRITKCYIEWN